MRKFINDNVHPPKNAVRIEELVNYFDYDYPNPKRGKPFSINTSLAPNPFNTDTHLMHVGVQGYEVRNTKRLDLNLTLLMDVSGSMDDPDKLPLVKRAIKTLLGELNRDDKISIVVYAGAVGVVLKPTNVRNKKAIIKALDNLEAGGSTAGGRGLELAYKLASENFVKDGVNRVMIMTDGDFNVGPSSPDALETLIEEKRETDIYLSVLGFGDNNYNDHIMQTLAQKGNGIAAYIDTIAEARKVLNDDLSANLFPIADDVKIQVEFNPDSISHYRLLGYETRALRDQDFTDDSVDAGETGSGASVTAIYEVNLVANTKPGIQPMRYEGNKWFNAAGDEASDHEYAFVKLRYKPVGKDTSIQIDQKLDNTTRFVDISKTPQWARWSAAVAGFGILLRAGPEPKVKLPFDYDDVSALAKTAKGKDRFGYREEFLYLVDAADTL